MINTVKVAFFDIDGTLHQGDTIWEAIHKKNGTWESHGKLYLEQYINKQINFEQFAYLDVLAWKGLPETVVIETVKELEIFPEAKQLLTQLRQKGVEVYIVSNSLSHVAKRIVDEFGLTGHISNDLVVKDGVLTGELIINIKYDEKGQVVRKILDDKKHQFSMAIGDGGNDLPMLKEVTHPILYNPRARQFPDYKGFVANDWQEVLGHFGSV